MEFVSSSSKLPRNYDVLINFTGEDIHRKFVSHLEFAFSTVGLTTFLHHQNAVKSTHIQQPILNLCRVAIVVFTKTYSESAWCLNQLQQIIKWHQTYCRHVLPVYYEIQPSDVRLQKGDFGKTLKATARQTFLGQQLEDGLSRWSQALTKAANFFGWDESNHWSDAELVDNIVKSVLNLPVLSVTKFPVGLQYRVQDVIQTIKDKSEEVCIIGIWGERGSGKTTLARAIYHQIHGTFTEKSFVEDISEVNLTRGYVSLQRQLLSDVLKRKVEIHSVEMGRKMTMERLSGKRVLIVLDDMNEYGPFFDLCRYRKRLSGGTVIIITTTDRDLLVNHSDSVFSIQLMNEMESIELLSWHAFREAKPKEEYNELVERVVDYCGGLPLALEVIGSTLFETTEEEWFIVLFELEENPQHSVIHKLKISFDCLRNQMAKDLFLDVCCFFVGKDRAYATKILNGCVVDADSGIRVLIERSLIKVTKNNKLGMHPLLREMGRQISLDILGNKHGKNIELRFEKDVEYALPDNTLLSSQKTEVMQRLVLTSRDFSELNPLDLRDPQTKFTEDPDYLYEKLRWIRLQGFSSEYLPNDYGRGDTIAIDLKHSLLQLVWKQPQVLRSLKFLNLSHSMHLKETPDLSGLPCLEQLILKCCPKLRKVHQSIGCLCNLLLLNLKDCTSLSNLPRGIYKSKSLRTLILSGCSKIEIMDKDITQMESLITLIAENTAVKSLPFSIVSSKSIGHLSIHQFEGLSRSFFPVIIRSWMSPTMNPISYMHSFCMEMDDNSWDDIAPLLSSLRNLRSVLVQCETEFQLSLQFETILAEYGVNITESRISKHHLSSSLIGFGSYNEFFSTISDTISEVLARASSESCDVSLPAVNDPYCLTHMGDGHSVSFSVRDMPGTTLCVVYLSIPKIFKPEFSTILIVNYTKCTCHIHNHDTVISFCDEDWHGIMSNLESGDKVEIFVTSIHGLVLINTVVDLISNNQKKELESEENCLIEFIKKVVMCDFW